MNKTVIEFTIRQLLAIQAREELRQHFTLQYWGENTTMHPVDQPEDPACGFSGCYMGWAAHQQWYARWGLQLELTQDLDSSNPSKYITVGVGLGSIPQFLQVNQGNPPERQSSIDALAYLLGVPSSVLGTIIYEEEYEDPSEIDPQDVAFRFRELLDLGVDQYMDLHVNRRERWEAERQADAA